MTHTCLQNGVAVSVLMVLLVGFEATPVSGQQLLGYWPFDVTSADEPAVDMSGGGNDGVFEGDADPNVEGAPGFGSGLFLDGIDSRVWLGAGDENGFGEITEDFTVMAWISPDDFESKNRVFGSAPWEANSGWGWGTVRDELELTTWGVRDYDQPVPLELDEWVHVAITFDSNFDATFYVDGEFVGVQAHDSGGGETVNDFYIGWAAVDAEHFSGLLDEVAIFGGVLSEEQIVNAMTLGVLRFDGDVDLLAPLNDGTLTDANERAAYVRDVLGTWVGDANLDGEFSSADFVDVFIGGEYEDGIPNNSTWVTGDWNGDSEFDSSDFVSAFIDGGFEMGPRAAVAAVPEPTGIVALVSGIIFMAIHRGCRRRR